MSSKLSTDELSVLLGQQNTHSRGVLSRIFQCSCAISGTAGLAHIGCIATPLSMTIAASSPTLASILPNVSGQAMMGMSALFAAGGLGSWWIMRGRKSGIIERAITVGGAALGLSFTLAMHGMLPGLDTVNAHHHINENRDSNPSPLQLSDLDKDAQIYARRLMSEAKLSEQTAVSIAKNICSQEERRVEP